MKVLSWHVREGARQGEGPGATGFEVVLEVLVRERPDVAALQELSGWSEDTLLELAEEAGYTHARFLEAASGAHHGLLSLTPLSAGRSLFESESTPEAAFAVETRDITLVSAYLTPESANESLREAERLMRHLPRDRTLVLGNFSVVRREERTPYLDAALPADLAERFPTTATTSVDALVHAGFVDAGEGAEIATSFLVGPAGEPLELRLEYALHTPGVEVRSLRVLEEEELLRTSPHLPIVLDIQL